MQDAEAGVERLLRQRLAAVDRHFNLEVGALAGPTSATACAIIARGSG